MDDRHEEGPADDRPENREGLPRDVKHERLRQVKLGREPRAEQRSDEADGGGDDEPAANFPCNRAADCSTDGRDDDQEDESRQCDGQDKPLSINNLSGPAWPICSLLLMPVDRGAGGDVGVRDADSCWVLAFLGLVPRMRLGRAEAEILRFP